MKRLITPFVLLCMAGVNSAHAQPALSAAEQGYIAYDQCLMHAAMAASKTAVPDAAIYEIAKADCATIRASVILGQEANKPYLALLDAVDADKAQRFPGWVKGVRERRRLREAGMPAPMPTPDR